MERKNFILFSTLILAIAVTILHVLAGALYLYWTYWWFDWMVHFLVSFAGGLGLYWGLFLSGIIFRGAPRKKIFAVLAVFLLVMAVGIGWEIFEYVNGITDAVEAKYYLDVMHDLLSDAVGALLAVFIGIKHNPSVSMLK